MAEASPHGQIEAKIKSLVQISDCIQKPDKSHLDNGKQNRSQASRQTDKTKDSLGLDDEAVISYQLVTDCPNQPSDCIMNAEDKKAKLQKKHSTKKKRNRSKKDDPTRNGEPQRIADSKGAGKIEERTRKNEFGKEGDKKVTLENKYKRDAKEDVNVKSRGSIKKEDKDDQRQDNNAGNTKVPSPEKQTSDNIRSREQERHKVEKMLSEDFVLAQNVYYKKEIVKELEKDCIFLLKKKSTKFPTAKFFCRLCDYHCFDMEHCANHKHDSRHKRLMKMRLIDQLLRNLPSPEPAHIQAVRNTIEKVYNEQHLSEDHLQERQKLTKNIQQLIRNSYKEDVPLVVYGSSHSTLGLKSSDVNMEFPNTVPPSYLKDAYLQLKDNQNKETSYVEDVQSDFFAKVPSVKFLVSDVKVRCQLSINNTSCHKTAELLYAYSRIDARLGKLAVSLRYLAKICKMDKQEEGSLPSYVFYLMTVFFLQQCKPPVLPVLHEIGRPASIGQDGDDWYLKDIDRLSEYWVCKNHCCVGELWIQMLRFYCIQFDIGNFVITVRQQKPLTRQEKKWTSKKLAIEDPFMRRRNVANCVSHNQVFEYIIEQLKVAYKHFGIPQLKSGPLFTNMLGLKEYVTKRQNRRKQHQITKENDSDSCDRSESCSTSETDVKQSGMDVFCQNSGTVSCVDSVLDVQTWVRALINEIFESAMRHLTSEGIVGASLREDTNSSAHQHSSTLNDSSELHRNEQALVTGHIHSTEDNKGDEVGSLEKNDNPVADNQDMTDSLLTDSSAAQDGKDVLNNTTTDDLNNINICSDDANSNPDNTSTNPDDSNNCTETTADTADDTSGNEIINDNTSGDAVSTSACPDAESMEVNVLKPDELVFNFDEKNLFDSKGPAIMCSICQREGHLKSSCPEENLPPLLPLPPLSRQYKDALNCLVMRVPKDFKPTDREMKMRQSVVCEVEREIQETYPGAKLQVFGSSCNGFGFRGSDLDICLTFANRPSLVSADPVTIIEHLAKVLKKQKTLYNVFPITTAKVPIVKFKHRPLQLEGDISLYNTLAIENTRMLRLYSAIDKRVVYLGYMMKVLAKICDICDASRGSLSSYAYILMVIYFLQQRKPPVIPVLQELLPKKGKKPEKIIDGWNAWFFDDLSQLPKVWPDYGKNKESPADLWLGLLSFYTEQFSFKEYVISIRQKTPLTKFERLWNTSTIAIEDPFDLSHNLGAGLSRRMNMFIIRTLRNARTLFGTSIYSIPNGYNALEDYLFDPNLLTDSLPPSDRNCHHCGKIGHFAKECPLMELKKEGEEEKRRQRQQQQQQQKQWQQQQHQQQQQQRQQQQERKAAEYAGDRQKQDMTRSKPLPVPQAAAQPAHIPGSPDYSRNPMLLVRQEYQHSQQHTPDNRIPMVQVNTQYSPPRYSPPHTKHQHQPVYVPPSPLQGHPMLAADQHIDPACKSVSQPQSPYNISQQICQNNPPVFLKSAHVLPHIVPCFPGYSSNSLVSATQSHGLPIGIIPSVAVQPPLNLGNNHQPNQPTSTHPNQPSNAGTQPTHHHGNVQKSYPVNQIPNHPSNQQHNQQTSMASNQHSNQQPSCSVATQPGMETSYHSNQSFQVSTQPSQAGNQQLGFLSNQTCGTVGTEQQHLINHAGIIPFGMAVLQNTAISDTQKYFTSGGQHVVQTTSLQQQHQQQPQQQQANLLNNTLVSNQQHNVHGHRETSSSDCSHPNIVQPDNQTSSQPRTVHSNNQQHSLATNVQSTVPGSQTLCYHNDGQRLGYSSHSGHHNVLLTQSLSDIERQHVVYPLDGDWPSLTSGLSSHSQNEQTTDNI